MKTQTRSLRISRLLLILAIPLGGCGNSELDAQATSTQDFAVITAGSSEESAVVSLVNDREITFTILDHDVGLDIRGAKNIVAYRNGADEISQTADDQNFESVEGVDAIPYIGKSALQKLLNYANAHGYAPSDSMIESSSEDLVVTFLNGPISYSELRYSVRLSGRASRNILSFRAGDDNELLTDDDHFFETIEDVDAISYVGKKSIEKLRNYVSTLSAQTNQDQDPRSIIDELGFTNMQIDFSVDEIEAQNGLSNNNVDFVDAISKAMQSLLTDEHDIESPLSIARRLKEDAEGLKHLCENLSGPELEACSRMSVEKYEAFIALADLSAEEILQKNLNRSNTTLRLAHRSDEYAAEHGEDVDGNWIFQLSIQSQSDHLYWAIVPRDGSAVYNYGFN